MTWIVTSILSWFVINIIILIVISINQALKKTDTEHIPVNEEDKLNDVVNKLKEIIRELENEKSNS